MQPDIGPLRDVSSLQITAMREQSDSKYLNRLQLNTESDVSATKVKYAAFMGYKTQVHPVSFKVQP